MALYKICVFLLRIWLKLRGCHIQGRENIHSQGPLLIIANHTSYADPLLLAAAFPQHISFIAKEGFYRKPLTRWLYGMVGAVFLNKEESDLTALRSSIKRLKEGRTVGIFPEGHRNRDQIITDFLPGASYIAVKAGAAVQPVAISNSKDLPCFWRRRSLMLNIGPAQHPTLEGRVNQQQLADLTTAYQQIVCDLYAENTKLLNK